MLQREHHPKENAMHGFRLWDRAFLRNANGLCRAKSDRPDGVIFWSQGKGAQASACAKRGLKVSLKAMVRIGILIGSTVGGYIPVIWGAEMLSLSSLFGSLLGGLLGVWIAYKIDQRF
ncbi:MAG: hypothetical protein ABI977_22460 [Acidobacteriota bacterium]